MAEATPKKRFANSNLNAVLGAPKAGPKNCGPAVHSAAHRKPVAKPKGLTSLGKVTSGSGPVRRGGAWSQLEAKAKEKEAETKKDELAKPEWAVMDFEDLDAVKPDELEEEASNDAGGGSPGADGEQLAEYAPGEPAAGAGPASPSGPEAQAAARTDRSRSWADQFEGDEDQDDGWAPPGRPPASHEAVRHGQAPASAKAPVPSGPPPRRSPPPGPPPSQSQAVSSTPIAAPRRPLGPPPPMPPPEPAPSSRDTPPRSPPTVPERAPKNQISRDELQARAGPDGLGSWRRQAAPAEQPARRPQDARPRDRQEEAPRPQPHHGQGPDVPPSQRTPTRGPAAPPPGGVPDAAPASCWGPAVAYTPAFAPRSPPADRPMSENFHNSGWKEKKLWAPPQPEKEERSGAGPRSRLRAEGAPPTVSQGIARTLASNDKQAETSRGGAGPAAHGEPPAAAKPSGAAPLRGGADDVNGGEPVMPPKPPKPPKPAKGSLEALDPDSDSDSGTDDSDDRPEYAVLDMNVPRTALVINVSHVLKRLNGCCSLNQLTKNFKNFKESTGVTLEAFLRAHPNNFKLEGRIVFLVDRDGNKWEPPANARKGEVEVVKGKGKGKAKDASEPTKIKGGPAKGKGESAKGKGESAKGKGESAKGKGESAKGKGESAKGKGESAKGKGESAKGKGKAQPAQYGGESWQGQQGGEGKKKRNKKADDEWESNWWGETSWDSGWNQGNQGGWKSNDWWESW